MSKEACIKKLLCDTTVPPPQRIVNAIDFMQKQVESKYINDPSEELDLKEIIAYIAVENAKMTIDLILKKLEIS